MGLFWAGWMDLGYGIAVDTAGAAHVTGFTDSADFPTMNALQPASAGSRDAFVSKLSPDGASLVYSTYLGGREDDLSRGITVDLTGATYVTGQRDPAISRRRLRCNRGAAPAIATHSS